MYVLLLVMKNQPDIAANQKQKIFWMNNNAKSFEANFFFLFIGREPTMWPANNCLQIMVCSCAMPSNCVWLQIIFCTCVKETVLFSFLRSLLCENGRSLCFPRIFIKKNKLGDRMIKQLLLTLVIAKYHDLSVSRRSIIWLSLWLQQIIDLLATDKSRYFAQLRPIILLIIGFSNTYPLDSTTNHRVEQCPVLKYRPNTGVHVWVWEWK